jgi:hypothetical protein
VEPSSDLSDAILKDRKPNRKTAGSSNGAASAARGSPAEPSSSIATSTSGDDSDKRPKDERPSAGKYTGADEDKGQVKEKGKAAVSIGAVGAQAAIHNQSDTAAALLLRPEYWSKRQYVSRKSLGNEQSRFMRPSYARVSTDCELSPCALCKITLH